MKAYVIEGPADIGNAFGFFKSGMLPADKFAVVRDGEYANGGRGPSTTDGNCYRTREGAEKALAKLEQENNNGSMA